MTTLLGIIWIVVLTTVLVKTNKHVTILEQKLKLAESKRQLLSALHKPVNLDAERVE